MGQQLRTPCPTRQVAETFTTGARRVGVGAAVSCALLTGAYAVTLGAGLWSLGSQERPIADPYFTVLEVLIIVLVLPMVALMGAVHAWARPEAKTVSQLALVFMALLAGVTCSVHFVILTVGQEAVSPGGPGIPLPFSFVWPSLAYALDILAWDVFFAMAALFAAGAFIGEGLARWIRGLLMTSGVLALAGLSGVAANDMRWRFIGIVGYVAVFPAAAVLMALLFHRATPRAVGTTGPERIA